jgi:NTP pyrophosphatase (non-canonical NTP hydrolase)
VIDNQRLAAALRSFASERDWDQFHTPKNLATSISVEASELLELFLWSRGQKGWEEIAATPIRTKVEDELADILLALIRFADKGISICNPLPKENWKRMRANIRLKSFEVPIANTTNKTNIEILGQTLNSRLFEFGVCPPDLIETSCV